MSSDGEDPLERLLTGIEEKTDVSKLAETFLSEDGIEGKTDLTDAQINLFWVLSVFHDRYPQMGYDKLGRKFMHLRISKSGNSRKGLIEMVKGMFGGGQIQGQPEMPGGMKRRSF